MPTLNEFLGFYFNGHHTSEFNLYSTAGGDRYSRSLFGETEEITESIPGRDGEFLFGTKVKTREMEITLSTDGVTELQLRQIKAWLNPKITGKLLFDEEPYKYYNVKLGGNPNFEFVPFDNPSGGTLYKGEIKITMVARDPYAYAEYMSTNDYALQSHPAAATNSIWGPLACINSIPIVSGADSGYKGNNITKINSISLSDYLGGTSSNSFEIFYGGTHHFAPTIVIDGTWEELHIQTNYPAPINNTILQVTHMGFWGKNATIYQNNGYCNTDTNTTYYSGELILPAINSISNANVPTNVPIKVINVNDTNTATFSIYFNYTYKYW